MKSARRQELRTNELSQQIDRVSDYVKQNMTMFSTVVLGAALVVAVIMWVERSRENKIMDAWASIGSHDMNEDPWTAVDRLQGIVDQNINRTVSAEALSRIGAVAQMQMVSPSPGATTQPAGRSWATVAEKAYAQLASEYSDLKSVAAHAKLALGVLAEDRNELQRARDLYKQVLDNKDLADSPYHAQAEYRLKGMDEWSKPVVFAPPPPMVMLPPTPTSQAATATLGTKENPINISSPNPGRPVQIKMNPTTQPAAH